MTRHHKKHRKRHSVKNQESRIGLCALYLKEWFEDYWTFDLAEAIETNYGLRKWLKEEAFNQFPFLPLRDREKVMWQAINLSRRESR